MYAYKEKKKDAVIQRKYYNANTNKITKRPKETPELTVERQACAARVKAQLGLAADIHFVANHKYPWENLKEDIEYAFSKTPPVPATTAALQKLEEFSGKPLPLKPDFLAEKDKRIELYGIKENEDTIDNWLASVCWTRSNIFFGPINRTDDPSKIYPDIPQFDAHMKKNRRMSIRSAKIKSAVFDKGGFRNPTSTVPDYTDIGITDEDLKTVLPGETAPADITRADLLTKIDTIAEYVHDEWTPYPASGGGVAHPDTVAKIQTGGEYLRKEECTFAWSCKNGAHADVNLKIYNEDNLYIEVTATSIMSSIELGYKRSDSRQKNSKEEKVSLKLTGKLPVKDDDASQWSATIPMPPDTTVGSATLSFKKPEGPEIKKALRELFFIRMPL